MTLPRCDDLEKFISKILKINFKMRTWTQGVGVRTHGEVKINTGESGEVPMSDRNSLTPPWGVEY